MKETSSSGKGFDTQRFFPGAVSLAAISAVLLVMLALSAWALPQTKAHSTKLNSQAPLAQLVVKSLEPNKPAASGHQQSHRSEIAPRSSVLVGPEILSSEQPLSLVDPKAPARIITGPAIITGSLPIGTGEQLPQASTLPGCTMK